MKNFKCFFYLKIFSQVFYKKLVGGVGGETPDIDHETSLALSEKLVCKKLIGVSGVKSLTSTMH